MIATLCMVTVSALPAGDKPFNLSLTTHLGDGQTFRDGDIVSFYVSLDHDAYLLFVYQDAGDRLNVLLPNALHPDNYFKAGLFIPIPNEQNPFQFRISAPFGTETLWVFASDQPFPSHNSQKTPNGASVLTGNLKTLRGAIQQHCQTRSCHMLFFRFLCAFYKCSRRKRDPYKNRSGHRNR